MNQSKLATIPAKQLFDTVEELIALTPADSVARERSIFAHSASLSLGGSRFPCTGFDCRRSRLYGLTQFAAMYSDKVYISNFLHDHVRHARVFDDREFRQRLYYDLRLIFMLKPLIEAGRIELYSPEQHYCSNCLARLNFGRDAETRFRQEYSRLQQHYAAHITSTLIWDKSKEEYRVEVVGPEELVAHGFQEIIPLPKTLELLGTDFLGRLPNQGKRVLRKSDLRRLRVSKHFADQEFASVRFELGCALSIGTAVLTDRPVQMDILTRMSEDPALEQRNHAALQHLTSLVPFLNGATVEQVLKIRNQEEEAFLLFRAALTKAIREYQNEKGLLTERAARMLYSDVIEPELARLTLKVKEAKRGLRTSVRQKIISWSGAITFGSFSGLVQGGLIAVAKAFGLTKAVSDLLESTMQKSDYENSIRSEEMYFLWKVKQQSERK